MEAPKDSDIDKALEAAGIAVPPQLQAQVRSAVLTLLGLARKVRDSR